jgi:chemotaxis protein methyltransferase WspC
MAIAEIESLLKRTMGLDMASVGLSTLERAIHQRMSAGGLADEIAYLEILSSSPSELQELIEAVVVPETWFFRDPEAFASLSNLILQEWLPSNPQKKLRILSIPCSTGEEPYTLAMTLHRLGLPSERFQIEAVDISERALALARQGVYGRNSFRSQDLDFRDRYFEETPAGYRLAEHIRNQVSFRQGNLMDADFIPGPSVFDYIFCRNLLIYFDRPTQEKAVKALKRLLLRGGLLFVGPAESALILNHQLASAKLPLAFAFRRSAAITGTLALRKKTLRLARTVRAAVTESLATLKPPPAALPAAPPPPPEPPIADLELAHRLADDGQWDEAIRTCERYLQKHPPAAKAFYLLGMIHDAVGEEEKARDHYRKALYLDPNHYETLMHLAYSMERNGDAAAGQNLRARANRVKERIQHA